jgi:hypothetical protein
LKDNAVFPVLAVVGGSGVGKSTLMRLLVKEGYPKPLAAPPQSAVSTTFGCKAILLYHWCAVSCKFNFLFIYFIADSGLFVMKARTKVPQLETLKDPNVNNLFSIACTVNGVRRNGIQHNVKLPLTFHILPPSFLSFPNLILLHWISRPF